MQAQGLGYKTKECSANLTAKPSPSLAGLAYLLLSVLPTIGSHGPDYSLTNLTLIAPIAEHQAKSASCLNVIVFGVGF